jgi:hypothetical protein
MGAVGLWGWVCVAIVAALLAAAAAGGVWFMRRPSPACPPAPPTEADMRRELALSLAVMLSEGEAPPAPPTAAAAPEVLARTDQHHELLVFARAWREAGGKPKNKAAFNDLVRALDAIADPPPA